MTFVMNIILYTRCNHVSVLISLEIYISFYFFKDFLVILVHFLIFSDCLPGFEVTQKSAFFMQIWWLGHKKTAMIR